MAKVPRPFTQSELDDLREKAATARKKKNEMGRAIYRVRDAPLVERLRKLEKEVGGRKELTDLVFTAISEARDRGEIEWAYTTRHFCQQHLRKLLTGIAVAGMRENIYEALELAVKELEGTSEGRKEEEDLAPSSDMRKLQRAVEQEGLYALEPSGSGHLKLVTGSKHPAGRGRTVLSERGGPIVIPSTPGDHRWRHNTVSRLRRASYDGIPVLTYDPFGQVENSKYSGFAKTPENEQKRLEGIAARSSHNEDQSRMARSLAEPIVARLGSWENYDFMHELTDVILHYGQSRDIPRWFNHRKTAADHETVFRALRRMHFGETLAEPSHQSMIVFFSDLDQAEDQVARYIELLREARGLKTVERELAMVGAEQETIPVAQEEPVVVAEIPFTEEEWRAQKAAIREAAAKPAPESAASLLAMEVLYEMSAGRDEVDRERVLALAMRVYQLETKFA